MSPMTQALTRNRRGARGEGDAGDGEGARSVRRSAGEILSECADHKWAIWTVIKNVGKGVGLGSGGVRLDSIAKTGIFSLENPLETANSYPRPKSVDAPGRKS
jgi:hypothetical protein